MLAHTHLAKAGANPYPDYLLKFLSYFMACYMPAFYVLSGYTFKDSPGILTKRFGQLITPYAIWSLIYFLCYLLVSICRGEISPCTWGIKLLGCLYSRIDVMHEGAGSILPLMPPGLGPLWFLTSLFTAYALYIPLHRAKGTSKLSYILGYILLTLLLHQCPILLPWSIDTAFAGALFIFAGNQIKRTGLFASVNAKSILTGAILLPIYIWTARNNGGSGYMFCRNYGSLGWYAPIVFLIMGITGTYLWCLTAMILEKSHLAWPLYKIGKHTLTLLCSHMFFYMIICEGTKYIITYIPHRAWIDCFIPYIFVIQMTITICAASIFSRFGVSLSTFRRTPH